MIWHEAYEFFGVLAVIVLTIFLVAVWLWRRSGSVGFSLGILMLYFWSLHGAWVVIYDLWRGTESARYQYLFERMFPVYLDHYYLLSLVLYGLFILVVGLTCILLVKPTVRGEIENRTPLWVHHWRLLTLASLALVCSFLIVRDQLVEVALLNRTGYALTSGGGATLPMYSLHQSLNRLAVIPLAIGAPVAFAGGDGLFIAGRKSILTVLSYTVLIVFMLVYGFLLGNKAEAFAGLLTGVLLYLANTPQPRIGRLFGGGAVVFLAITLVDYVRTVPLSDLMAGNIDGERALSAPLEILRSNEAYATHFSLYGVLAHDVPMIDGRGVISLATAFVPRILWPDRPPVTYAYYSKSLGLPEDQGFTLHHVTGWYLNFGVPGVIIGGAVLGALWVGLFNRMRRSGRVALLGLIGFVFVTGGLADFVRAGVASYKSLLLYNILFPYLVVLAASWRLLPETAVTDSTSEVHAS